MQKFRLTGIKSFWVGIQKSLKTLEMTVIHKDMKKIFVLAAVLAMSFSTIFAQRVELTPYPDAVPLSDDGLGKVYLSNTDSKVLMEFFASEYAPDKIIPIKDGYFSGYRLCFTGGCESPGAESADWIQVLTIDEEAAFAWFMKNTPEYLTLPFEGLKSCVNKNGHKQRDYEAVVEEFKYLACRMYRQAVAPDGTESNEMNTALLHTRLTIGGKTEAMYASLESGGVFNTTEGTKKSYDAWNDWVNCYRNLNEKGFVTLIEFNEPAITPF